MRSQRIARTITMPTVCRLLLGCIYAILLCFPCPVRSDFATMELKSGTISPKKAHPTIRMDSEQVIIRLGESSYSVEAIFHFFNTGPRTREWVGFPKRGVYDFKRFNVWVDGKEISFSEEPHGETKQGIAGRVIDFLSHSGAHRDNHGWALPENRWLVQHITFPGNAQTSIRVEYEGYYDWGLSMEYILETGAYWKDRIGKALFIIDCSDVGGTENVGLDLGDLETMPGVERMGANLLKLEIGEAEPPPGARIRICLTQRLR